MLPYQPNSPAAAGLLPPAFAEPAAGRPPGPPPLAVESFLLLPLSDEDLLFALTVFALFFFSLLELVRHRQGFGVAGGKKFIRTGEARLT